MDRLAHRDLRNRSADVLRDVAAGASYEITNHGDVVAILSPPPAAGTLRVRKARLHGGFADLPRGRSTSTVQEVLDDLREER